MADTKTLHGLDDVLDTPKSLPPEIASKRGGPVKSALRKGGVVVRKPHAGEHPSSGDRLHPVARLRLHAKCLSRRSSSGVIRIRAAAWPASATAF